MTVSKQPTRDEDDVPDETTGEQSRFVGDGVDIVPLGKADPAMPRPPMVRGPLHRIPDPT